MIRRANANPLLGPALFLAASWSAPSGAWSQAIGDVPAIDAGLGVASAVGPGAGGAAALSINAGIGAPSLAPDGRGRFLPAPSVTVSPSISPRDGTPHAVPARVLPPGLPPSAIAADPGPDPAAAHAASAGAERGRPADGSPQASPRGPPELAAAIGRADRYIRSIAGGIRLREDQRRGLLALFMEESVIDPDSPLGRALLESYFPREAAEVREAVATLDPRFDHFASLILSLAKEYDAPPARVEALVRLNGLENVLARSRDKATVETLLRSILFKDEVQSVVARYPDNAQGAALRELASHLIVKTGKSLEEITRSGAFLYADFAGASVRRLFAGRDPDVSTVDAVFYVRLENSRWNIGVYRQNARPGRGRPDSFFTQALKDWLVSGGIPASDFAD